MPTPAIMLRPEEANELYWKIVWIIEPALHCHNAPLHEPIDEKSRRLALETLVKGKAKAIMSELVDAMLVERFIPSVWP